MVWWDFRACLRGRVHREITGWQLGRSRYPTRRCRWRYKPRPVKIATIAFGMYFGLELGPSEARQVSARRYGYRVRRAARVRRRRTAPDRVHGRATLLAADCRYGCLR